MSVKIIKAYDGQRTRVVVDASKPVLTKQAELDEADINKIVKRFMRGKEIPPIPADMSYGFDPGITFHDAMNAIQEGNEFFEQNIPAEIRSRFENDMGRFLQFVDDPANAEEMVEMGLFKAPAEPEPAPEPPAEPPAE